MGSVNDTTTILGEQEEQKARGSLAIWWLLPGATPQVRVLDRAEMLLGRGDEADVSFEASGVSRLHARLRRQGPIFAVQDLGSTNGTFVNGRAVAAVSPLGFGDEVAIGQVRLRLERARPVAA